MGSTILIVDDEIEVTRALARVVASPDRRVITLHDPYEALEVVAREVVDLVITDKDMPRMSGHMLIDALKASHPDIPCVILTGAPDLASALVALNGEQVVRYMTKPYDPAEMRATVEAGLARRAANQEARAVKRVAEAREALLREVSVIEPMLLDVTPGSLQGVGPLGQRVDDVVRQLASDDPTAATAVRGVQTAIAQAPPSQIADAFAGIPARRGTVGALLVPHGDTST
ncbi:MAG: response regulator, partial [Deltaproteobacteria bacterium]|nr:response regulator [Kofleriaceae bacterium]